MDTRYEARCDGTHESCGHSHRSIQPAQQCVARLRRKNMANGKGSFHVQVVMHVRTADGSWERSRFCY